MTVEPVPAIRSATTSDAPVLAALSHELGYEVTAAEMVERLGKLPVTDRVLVAEVDGDVLGWVHLAVYRTLLDPPSAGVLGLVVTERSRGRGVGRLLMDRADAFAREHGLPKVTLRSNVIRNGAHRFYERIGFVETKRQLTLVRGVEPFPEGSVDGGRGLATGAERR